MNIRPGLTTRRQARRAAAGFNKTLQPTATAPDASGGSAGIRALWLQSQARLPVAVAELGRWA